MENKSKFNVAFCFADKPQELNTSIFRCLRPGKALAKAGYGVSGIPIQLFQENRQDAREALEKSNVIVIERNFIGDVLTQIMYWKVRGKVIIGNWDDNYGEIEETNISYHYWKSGTIKMPNEKGEEQVVGVFPHPYDQFIWGLKAFHAATLPSKPLIKYYEQYVPTYFVGNYFNTENYLNIPKDKRNYIVIGWGGSVSHLQSFRDSGILKAFQNICTVRPNVKILTCGDDRVLNSIELPEDKKLFQPYVPYDQWGNIVASKFDIGIAPLCGEYDKYRSNIKIVEYMMTKTPFVASKGEAYQDYYHLGNFTENTEDDWTQSLLNVIDNLESEKEKCSKEPYQYGVNQEVDLHVEEIADVYREIAEKHAKLRFN